MKKIMNIVKSPITWIVCAVACIVGVVMWVFTGKTDTIEDLKD